MLTGTFAPLLNQREYTKNEKIVLNYFFTNTDKNVYCAKYTISQQLWAFLSWRYTKSNLSFRDVFLQLFDELKTNGDNSISIDELAQNIQNSVSFHFDIFDKMAADFFQQPETEYQQKIIKDSDRIRCIIEGVSQVFTKVIEAPFPPIGEFMEKTPYYNNYKSPFLIVSDDMKKSPFGAQIIDINQRLLQKYIEYFPKVRKILEEKNMISKNAFSQETSYQDALDTATFDIVKYFLPVNTATSLCATMTTRVLEQHLSYMYTHPLEEVRYVALSIYEEAIKISPGVLRLTGISQQEIKQREKLQKYIDDLIGNDDDEEIGLYQGIEDTERVNVIFEGDLDNMVCASMLFEASKKQGFSFDECLDIVDDMDSSEKEILMSLSLGDRKSLDPLPRSLQHSTILFDFFIDFFSYKSIQRHRASYQLWQGTTAIHGYDYPKYMDLKEIETCKKEYDDIMTEATILSKNSIKHDEYISQYIGSFGHLVRATFECNPAQLIYVLELRTGVWVQESTKRLFLQTAKECKKLAPILSKFIKITGNNI